MSDLILDGATVYLGDCIQRLKELPAGSMQMCVTSPPYFGLRDYGHDGQLGMERTPEQYVAAMVDVFRYVHKVLADDGVLLLNIGDSYYNHRTGHNGGMPGQTVHCGRQNGKPDKDTGCPRRATKLNGIREKELIGIPWMLAFALRADGWLIRQEIIWSKPNPTPEKVTDRFTRSHEQVFLLTKRSHYTFDSTTVMEAGVDGMPRRRRSVWEIRTSRAPGAHFATFPTDLVEPCILAGSRPGDLVLDPFNGSGTTGQVAIKHGRRYVGIELNPEYIELTRARLCMAIEARAEALAAAAVQPPQFDLFDEAAA